MAESKFDSLEDIYDSSYQGIVEALPIGTLVFRVAGDELQIITINERLLQFANVVHTYVDASSQNPWNKERLQEAFSDNIYAFAVDEDIPVVKKLVEDATETGYSQATFRLRGTSGEGTKWINTMCSCKQLKDQSKIYYTLFLDNTNQVLYERELLDKQKELEHISRYDTLTNVRNRYSYSEYLETNRNVMKRQTGIIFTDINGLKAANDEFGHLFGDRLIMAYAELLLEYFKREDIFRISGDEFVIIQEDIEVVDFENKVREFMRAVDEQEIAAVGYKWESTVVDMKQAIFQTEQLMMIQKQRYYVNNSDLKSKHRPKILKSLLEELNNHRYVVYWQPKAAMGSMKVIGAEALIRKTGTNGEIIPPFEFVPVLEKELLIPKIDFFVLEEVCKQLKEWKEKGKRLIKVSVNMSRVSVAETDFLEHILEICEKYGVEHQYLELEITESTDTKDNRKLPEIVSTLDELGFGVSLDDMGSDYSSLKMLTMKGIDTIKIDRSLVLQIHQSEGAALIRYIIALCHEIGKACIAEGVEDIRQASILADMKCDYYQGYLLNKPIPVTEFEAYLAD